MLTGRHAGARRPGRTGRGGPHPFWTQRITAPGAIQQRAAATSALARPGLRLRTWTTETGQRRPTASRPTGGGLWACLRQALLYAGCALYVEWGEGCETDSIGLPRPAGGGLWLGTAVITNWHSRSVPGVTEGAPDEGARAGGPAGHCGRQLRLLPGSVRRSRSGVCVPIHRRAAPGCVRSGAGGRAKSLSQ